MLIYRNANLAIDVQQIHDPDRGLVWSTFLWRMTARGEPKHLGCAYGRSLWRCVDSLPHLLSSHQRRHAEKLIESFRRAIYDAAYHIDPNVATGYAQADEPPFCVSTRHVGYHSALQAAANCPY